MATPSLDNDPIERRGPRLPLELQEAIIDVASTDTLKMCRLTCKTWSARGRKRLFAAITLSPGNIDSFLRLLSTSPDIGLLARHLGLHELSWCDLGDEKREAILNGFPLVYGLYVGFCQFSTVEQVVRVVSSFPCLKHLYDSGNRTMLPAPVSDGRRSSELPSALQHLCVFKVFCSSSMILDWFLTLQSLPPIETFRYAGWFMRSLIDNGVHLLLSRLGSSLKDLGMLLVDNPEKDVSYEVQNNFTLSQNTSLQHLQIHAPCSFIPEILAQITSDKLAELKLDLTEYAMSHMDWTRVESILCQSMWSKTLSTVHIEVEVEDVPRDSCLIIVKEALPVIAARGILVVTAKPLPTALPWGI